MFWDTCSGALDWQACLSEISMVCLEQLCPTTNLLDDMFRSFGLTHLFLTVFDGMFGVVMAYFPVFWDTCSGFWIVKLVCRRY